MMSSEHVIVLTDDNFQAEVLESELPVLVDFWAEWCMPCKMLAPTIDELAEELAGKLKVCKLDTDQARETAMQFAISAIPTLLVFKGGEKVSQLVGLQQKADLKAQLEQFMD